jgi:hypothetical protein
MSHLLRGNSHRQFISADLRHPRGYMFIPRGVKLVRLVDTPGGTCKFVTLFMVGMLQHCVPEVSTMTFS